MNIRTVHQRLLSTGRLTTERINTWRDSAEMIAALDGLAQLGLNIVLKIDGGRADGAPYTVVVSGDPLGETFFRQDGADLKGILGGAVEFCFEKVDEAAS